MCAIRLRSSHILLSLLSEGCDPRWARLHGRYSNLAVAAGIIWKLHNNPDLPEFHEMMRICRLLILCGATDFRGTGLLQLLAAFKPHVEESVKVARLLIQKGANVDEIPPPDQLYCNWNAEYRLVLETALREAVQNDFASMVEMLLEQGADPALKSPIVGTTVLQWAKSRHRLVMVGLLEERGIRE